MRPAALPAAATYEHGKRARYVSGCRCDDCRAANAAYYHVRKAAADAAALAAAAPAKQGFTTFWTDENGRQRKRRYQRSCPGVDGKPCPKQRHLRKDSKGGRCGDCSARLVWNGLVDAAPARRHLRKLSRRGVGYKQVADSACVSRTSVAKVLAGTKRQLRADSARRILEVTAEAIADHATVPAKRVRRLLRKLLEEGFTQSELATRLGSKAKTPALQVGKSRVLASTQLKVERFYQRVMT